MTASASPAIWQQFQHPDVRSLAWARFAPPLVSGMNGRLPSSAENDLAFFREVDDDPTALVDHLASCNSHRLGYYLEELWSFYFQRHPQYQLLIHNTQVMTDDKRTLGAFDFIYQYLPTEENHHLEVAVKFYLFVGEEPLHINEQLLWPGPNPKDNLFTKVQRLESHQIPLSFTAEGKATVEQLGHRAVSSAAAALSGYLFYPWGKSCPAPEWAPTEHCRGQWLPISQLSELLSEHGDNRWYLLAKREWLGARLGIPETASYSGEELRQLLAESLTHYPVMVARLEKAGGGLDEVERFFVAPESWPNPK